MKNNLRLESFYPLFVRVSKLSGKRQITDALPLAFWRQEGAGCGALALLNLYTRGLRNDQLDKGLVRIASCPWPSGGDSEKRGDFNLKP